MENEVKDLEIQYEISKEEIKNYIHNYNIELDDIEKQNSNLIHSKIGAYICKNKYNFTDDMVNSVMYHTTGRENMSILEKIVYLADATEENRKYCSKYYVDIVKENIDKGIVEIQKWTINKLLEENILIHPDSIKCYNYYIIRSKWYMVIKIVDFSNYKKAIKIQNKIFPSEIW